MKKKEKTEDVDLEKALDESLDILQKAAGGETISKSAEEKEGSKGSEEEGSKGSEEEGSKGSEEEGSKGSEAEEMKGEKKDDEEDEEDEEAKKKGFKKGVEDDLSKSEAVQNAVEVSKFLKEFIKSQADIMGDMVYRIKRLETSNRTLGLAFAKSVGAQNDMLKSFGSDIKTVGGKPIPRKSVDGSSVSTLEKGFRNNPEGGVVAPEGSEELSKSQVADKMANLEMESKIPQGSTTKFEMTGEMSKSVESQVLGGSK